MFLKSLNKTQILRFLYEINGHSFVSESASSSDSVKVGLKVDLSGLNRGILKEFQREIIVDYESDFSHIDSPGEKIGRQKNSVLSL